MKKQNFRYKNEEEIKAYLADNNMQAQRTDSGLYYLIIKEGEGASPKANSNVAISYIGYMTNGNVFDQNESLEISLTDVIEGWQKGLLHFKEGGEGVLFIPSHLAYGSTDYGTIPGGSVLIFDIQLIEVIS